MKLGLVHLLILILIISCLFPDDSEGWRRRRRRRRRRRWFRFRFRRIVRFGARIWKYWRYAKPLIAAVGRDEKLNLDTMARDLKMDKSELQEVFNDADLDGDGLIDEDELKRALDEDEDVEGREMEDEDTIDDIDDQKQMEALLSAIEEEDRK